MNNEEKIQLYSCIKRQFTDPGLYKSSRIYEWLYTNGYSLDKLGYNSFEELCGDFPEVFMFQDDPKSEFVLIKSWQNGDRNISAGHLHPADNFFGTKNIILNDDIIEMTQQSLYALTKILGSSLTVQQMKQEVFKCFEEAKQSNRLDFLGERYVFPIDYCPDRQLVNGVITKNINSHGKSLYFSFEKTRISRGIIERKPPISAIPAEIPEEEKMHIYSLLTGNFPLNHQLHLAAISKFLTDCGVDRTKFGYFKMKDFLAQLSFLEMKEIVLGGVPQFLVTIKELYPEKKSVYSAARYPSYSRERVDQKAADYVGRNSAYKIPSGVLTDFCNLPAKPIAILEKFIEESGQQTDLYDTADIISKDFDDARRSGAVHFYGGKLVFPCRYKKSDGSNVELTLKPSAYEGKEWFLYYVDTAVHESKISAFSPLKQLESFAYLGNWQIMLSGLAALAAYEEWDFNNSSHKSFQILNRYLKFTFSRILREKKLCISPNREFAAFNTGLVDKHYDDIFACFVPNEGGDSEWKLVGFCTAFSSVLGKNLADIFNPLPIAAAYFTRNDDMFFDFNKYLHIDYEHLLLDNIHRFPLSFLYEQLFDNQEARGIIEKLRSVYDISERIRLFEHIKEIIASNVRLSMRLQNCLKSSVEFAKKRVRRNYKTAVPSYFPKHDATALMLPLALNDETSPDVALVLEITRLGSYQAQSVLTLPQAYIDARLVSCLSADWLTASQINTPPTAQDIAADEEISAIN